MTSLNTETTREGVVLTDEAGQHCFTIKYNRNHIHNHRDPAWRLVDAAEDTVSEHTSIEAAEYRALSEYIDAQ